MEPLLARVTPSRPPAPGAGPWRAPAIVLVVALLVPLLNMIPTWDGYLSERPPGKVFLGFRYMAGDHYQYGSFARQVADEGRLLMENRFTTEAQRPSYFLLYFWIVGTVSRLTGLSFPTAWEALRLIFGASFMMVVWRFTALVFPERRSRLIAYLFVAFSGGLAWAVGPFLPEPIPGQYSFLRDPWNYQWNWSTFSSMLVPLWIAPCLALLLCGVVLTREPRFTSRITWAVGLTLPPIIWFMHPHTGNAAYLAFGAWAAMPALTALWSLERIPWTKVRANLAAVLPFLLSFSIVAAYVIWAGGDAVFKTNSGGAFVWNPAYSLFWYPITYGLLLPLAAAGIRWSGSVEEKPRDFVAAWLLSTLAFSLNPLYSGVKFQYLLHLPLAVFAAHGLAELRRRSERMKSLTTGLSGALLGAALFMNAPVMLVKDMPKTATDADIYLTSTELEAMRFLDSQPPGNVLCTQRSGNRIAWLSRKKVFSGHWLLTVDLNQKEYQVAAFLHPSTPLDQKQAFLKRNGIAYVYLGPNEARLGDVDARLGLARIHEAGDVRVFKVP